MLLTGVILFAVSFDTLEPTEMGLKYNRVSVTVEPEVYNYGRFFLGLGRKFIKFPGTMQLIELKDSTSLRAWSKEGQLIELDVSVDYRLERDNLYNLYRRYGEDYHTRLIQATIKAIKLVTIQYEATDFFTSRDQIGDEMKASVSERFDKEFVTLELFNLRNIDLPNGFEQKVVDKVVERQKVQIGLNLKEISLINANITVIRGEGDAEVDEILATANAESAVITQNALSENIKRLRQAEALAYKDFISRLGIQGKDLLSFKWGQEQSRLAQDRLTWEFMVGLESPVLSVKRT